MSRAILLVLALLAGCAGDDRTLDDEVEECRVVAEQYCDELAECGTVDARCVVRSTEACLSGQLVAEPCP